MTVIADTMKLGSLWLAGRLSEVVWEKSHTSNGNVNDSTSNVANQSNNESNANSSLSYLNVNNSSSNTNDNISSQLLRVELKDSKVLGLNCGRVTWCIPHLLVENKVWASKYQ